MYDYAFYGYMAFKAYEYSGIIEYALSVGRSVRRVYNWLAPEKPLDPYTGWVLLDEDKDSFLYKN